MARRRRTKHSVEVADGGQGVVVLSRRAAKEAARAEKQQAKAAKADRAAAKKVGRAELARVKEEAKEAERAEAARVAEAEAKLLTGAKVKRWIGIARVVVPVAAPIIYQAAGLVRSQVDDRRARRLGVAPEDLSSFSGRGTALHARAHNLATSVRELASRRPDAAGVREFVPDAEQRLSDLEAAVRAAEQMPGSRRRRAHLAIAAELDRLESRLLTLWGLDRPGDAPGLPAAGR